MSAIMTLHEVCRYLKTSKYTVYRLIKGKEIPASRIGGQWRFQKEFIDQWFLEQCVTRRDVKNGRRKEEEWGKRKAGVLN